jgi:hypothetical protein
LRDIFLEHVRKREREREIERERERERERKKERERERAFERDIFRACEKERERESEKECERERWSKIPSHLCQNFDPDFFLDPRRSYFYTQTFQMFVFRDRSYKTFSRRN